MNAVLRESSRAVLARPVECSRLIRQTVPGMPSGAARVGFLV